MTDLENDPWGLCLQSLLNLRFPLCPPITLSPLQAAPRDFACKTRGQDGFAVLLCRRALSPPATSRFIPALSASLTIHPRRAFTAP